MKRILIACTVVALASCVGKDENGDGIADGVVTPDTVSEVAPSTPVGTVSGQVVKLDNSPLDGVKVTLIVGTKVVSANTASNGTFSFKDVQAGAPLSLLFEKQGFATGRAYGTISSTAGNFPINNGNLNVGQVGLAAMTGTAQFRVVTAEGAPASGASATVEFTGGALQMATGGATVTGLYSATTTVGADGILKFDNVPDFQSLSALQSYWSSTYVSLAISPWDENADGVLDWRGYYNGWSMTAYLTAAPVQLITLQPGNQPGSLGVVGSTLASFTEGTGSTPFRNALKNNDAISITFNQPINEVSTARWVKVVAEDCKTDVAVTTTQVSPWTIQITPTAGWTLGAKYNVAVHVTGLDTGDSQTFVGYGFGLDATQAKPVSSYALVAEKPSGSVASNIDLPMYPLSTPGSERMWAVFDVPMKATGGAEAYLQLNLDLDNSAGNLESCGETGNKFRQGWSLYADEPTSGYDNKGLPANTFACLKSGYTTKWLVAIANGYGCSYAPFPATVASTTSTKVLFPNTTSSADTYQSITGASVTGELSASSIQINVLIAP